MEDRLQQLEHTVEDLKKQLNASIEAQQRAVEMFTDFADKCSNNFNAIAQAFENLHNL